MKEGKVAIGKCVKDKLVPLTSKDIELCKSRRWKYDSSFLNEGEEDQGEEDEGDATTWDDRDRRESTPQEIDTTGGYEEEKSSTDNVTKAIKTITAVPDEPINESAKQIKKSMKDVIHTTNKQATDIVSVLEKLTHGSDSDSDHVEDEEQDEDDDELVDEDDELVDEDDE